MFGAVLNSMRVGPFSGSCDQFLENGASKHFDGEFPGLARLVRATELLAWPAPHLD